MLCFDEEESVRNGWRSGGSSEGSGTREPGQRVLLKLRWTMSLRALLRRWVKLIPFGEGGQGKGQEREGVIWYGVGFGGHLSSVALED